MSANEPKPASPRVRRPPPVVPVRREGPPPLSFAQRRMWFLSRLDPSGFAYNAPFFARLKGRLDVSTLERALTEVVRRHEALRTTFAEVEGEPVQCIAPEAPVSLVVERLEGPEREQEARRLAEEEARRPFDLGTGPMLRARLLRLGEEEHVLLLTLHHISCDGWSLSLLERDVGELYGAFLEGREPKLPALTVQYADHAVWQREWLKGEVLEEQLAWWKQHLEGASPALELPTDRPRPPVQSAKGAVLGVPLPAELMKALRERCKQVAVTPFMLLLASLQALLSRHSGQADVVVGTPIAGRTRREVEGLIGFFANTLALRVDVDGNESFKSLLGRVRQACLGAYQHQDVPFERLVDALRPVRDLSRSPLFQVLLVLQNAPPLVRLSGLESRDLDFEPGVAKFDLTLFVRETPEGWVALWEYSTALFDEATVRRFAGHYVALLKGVLEDPERKVGQVDLLDEEERRKVLVKWPWQEEVLHPSWLMHRRGEAQAARTPSAVAVTNGGGSLTYAQLEQRANQLAHHLMALGVRPGGVVGLYLQRSSFDLPVAVLATLKTGAACLPLDPGYPPSRLARMLDDVGAPVVLVHAALEHALPEEGTARRVRLEEEAARIAEQSTVAPGWVLSPELPCYVLFTSGSTGRPKGVTMSHRAFGTLVNWQLASTSVPGARTLQFASLSFDVSFQELFCTLGQGGTLVLVSAATRQDPATLMAYLREHRVERLFVPFVALQALSERARHETELPPLREVVTAGEPLQVTPAVVSFFERLPGCVLENQYGPTETHVVTAWRAKGPPSTWPALPPVGRPIVLATVLVLDAWGAPCPIGVTGEVCVGERSLAHGYWGRPELTAERFVPNVLDGDRDGRRMYRTGDRGRWLADGNLELQGRADEQVKVRGFRVELGEVEGALKELPGVTDAAVVVRRTDGGEKRLVAYVVRPESGDAEDLKRRLANQLRESGDAEDPQRQQANQLRESWDAEDLKRRLAKRLPEYMVPGVLVRLDALPLTPSGKVNRRALPEVDSRRAEEGTRYEAPRDALERTLAEVWQEVLGVSLVGVKDDFFALGGHSLLATRVVSRLRDALGHDVPVRLLFEAPTVEALAERLGTLGGHARLPVLTRAERLVDPPLSFAQRRLWFLAQLDAGGHSYNLPFVVRLHGALKVESLERALAEVVRRHEALRTSFVEVGGEPVQRVAADAVVPLTVESVEGADDVEEAVRSRVVREVQAPFDVARTPLLRATLLRTRGDEQVLVVVLHHLVADGWSLGVLTRELEALYGAAVKGETASLPELPVQYADYSVWQHGWLTGDVEASQLSWWKEALKGAPPVLELPTDRPRPAVQGYRGASVPVRLSSELSESLRRLSRREGATLYMTLLAGFQVLLARYSGQWDVVVGSPVSGRTTKEVEGLIGFFVNTLVVRTEAAKALTFRELLAQVRESVLGAFAHQEVPFEKLVDALQLSRDLSRSPLVQVSFALQSAPSGELSLPGLALRPLDLGTQVAKFDLALSVREDAEGMAGYWVFNTDLFDTQTVERLAIHYERLLEAAVAMPEARLDALEMPGHMDVPERAPSARIRAQRTERRELEESLESFIAPRTAMEARVAEIWAPLLGVKRVGAEDNFFERGGHSLLVMQVASRLRETLGRDVPVRMLFEAPTVSALASRLDELVKDGLRTGRPALVRTARTEALPQSFAQQRLWFLDRLEPGGSLYNIALAMKLEGVLEVGALERAFNELVRRHESLRTTFHQHEQGSVQRIHAAASLPLSVVDLSGLAAETREQEALRWGGEEGRRPFDLSTGPLLRVTVLKLGEQEHVLVLVLHHIVADGWSTWVLTQELETLYGAYVKGEAATLPELPVQYVDYAVWQREWLKGEVLEEQLSWWRAKLAGVPEALEVPTDRPRPAVQGYQGASVVVKLSSELSEKLKQLSLREGVTLYMTLLAGFQVLLARYSGQWDVVVGSPVSGRTTKEVEGLIGFFVNTLVVRTEASSELTFREMLERVKESVLGAFGHQEVPFEKLVEALQSSRDLSRAPLVQIAFGLNGPAQLPALPGLSSSEVTYEPGMAKFDLALSVREDAEELTGFWELNTDLFDAETVERLATHYQQVLEAAVENPEAVLRELPMSGHQEVPVKVPVARLQSRRLDRLAPESVPEGYIAPRTAIEELVAGVWAPLLGVKHVGAEDNFFERGGHSLLVMQVASRLREVLGREVSVRMLFEAPTVATLARSLETVVGGGAGRGRPELVPTTRTEASPQSFAQQRLWFLDRLEPNSPLYNIPLAMRLTGVLDVAALEHSFHTLVRRHESLRTTFEQGGQGATQHIHPFEPAPLSLVDLSSLPIIEREREALRLGVEEGQRPFDLGQGPLLRVTLLKLDEQEHGRASC